MPYTKRSKEHKRIKRNVQMILIGSLMFFSLIIGYFGYFNNNERRSLGDWEWEVHEQSGSDQGNIVEDEHLYPKNLFTEQEIREWAWILHFIGMFYMFVAISIICDDYFVPTLECIVERLGMSDDTAGATWLAAGGSAPELFTSFIGIFIAKSDVGFGTIVGSAVFNVLFVVGMCAFFTPGDLPLTWWPFARDLTYYIISLGFLCLFFGGTSPGKIDWWESGTLFALYILYVYLMSHNQDIKAWFFRKFVNEKATLLSKYQAKTELVQKETCQHCGKENPISYQTNLNNHNNNNNNNSNNNNSNNNKAISSSNYTTFNSTQIVVKPQPIDNDSDNNINDDNNSEDSDDDSEENGPDLSWPGEDSSTLDKLLHLIKYPIMWCGYMTLADVTKEESKKYWPWTFVGSLLWLGTFSYFMVWWAVVVGHSWNIPDEIMGLTFLAAGTSVPELFSCIIVSRKGKADMAVSGSIGSNIFDVLVGLSLPWFFFAVIQGGGTVKVEADRLFLSIILLVGILITLTCAIIYNKWVLTHSLGIIMFLLWVFFVVQDLLRHFMDLDTKWFGQSLVVSS